MSSLSWIAFDEHERRRAQRIMALFNEKVTRDELGLGPIRDSIADHLFPGTSTIQSRLRYMLFVPWILRSVEDVDAPPNRLAAKARDSEVRLVNALKAGGEQGGVIGSVAGKRLLRMPSSIYWNGLWSWGIRLFRGSQQAYFTSLRSLRAHRRAGTRGSARAATGRKHATWHPSLPQRPEGLLEKATFQLSCHEASFLTDRIVNSQPKSLLAHLAKARRHADCAYIWEHPDLAGFPDGIRRVVRHAEIFSAVMQGASLLYNLMLSEERENEEWIQRYRGELDGWKAEQFGQGLSSGWSLEDFWTRTKHENHRIRPPTQRFVHHWHELAAEKDGDIADDPIARELVRQREKSLKRAQSRFANHAVLDSWGGRSGADRLEFRWRDANRHLRDLANAA